ncbi:hypothetical protein [Nonomuraea sp. B5E05]|uniref:hypothetical protein n=1 Tax=Nonomuraea sp. B5E05 TaxID=3153569 RepID=UPI0032609129
MARTLDVAQYGRFPEGRSELPDEAVAFVAGQVKVPAAERHRAQIRTFLDFGECIVADAERLTHGGWPPTCVIGSAGPSGYAFTAPSPRRPRGWTWLRRAAATRPRRWRS